MNQSVKMLLGFMKVLIESPSLIRNAAEAVVKNATFSKEQLRAIGLSTWVIAHFATFDIFYDLAAVHQISQCRRLERG